MTRRMRKVVTAVAAIAALATGGAVLAQAQNSSTGTPATENQPAQQSERADGEADGEREDGGRETEREDQATGPEAERAKDAALQATGGGTATSVGREESERAESAESSERESEDGGKDDQNGFQSPQGAAWEVEVTKADGTQVEIYLDKDYTELATHKADADE